MQTKTQTTEAERLAWMQTEIERLKAENARLAERPMSSTLTLKVSAKGAVSVYGLGRWPTTLYQGQIERLDSQGVLTIGPKLRAFMDANQGKLARKE